MNSAKVIKLPSHSNMHHFAEAENGREHTWFWRKKVDGTSPIFLLLKQLLRKKAMNSSP